MGVSAALTPVAAPPQRTAADVILPSAVVAQRSPQLVQRACDCGEAAAFSGRCDACDRTSLQSRFGRDGGRPAAALSAPTPTAFAKSGVAGVLASDIGAARTPAIHRAVPFAPQMQLLVSSPGDAAEMEAQAVGKHIAHMAEPAGAVPIARADIGADRVFRSAAAQPDMHPDTLAELQRSRSAGMPLPLPVRNFMEPRFGADFGSVRLHVGERASALCGQLGAQAFTVGHDIYFGRGRFQPDTPAGRELIAHELTHTIQQHGAVHRPVAGAGGAAAVPALPVPAAPPPAARTAPVAAPPAARATPVAAPPAARPVPAATPVIGRAPVSVQGFGISDAWSYFADKANNIPGFRMLTIVLGVNPLTMGAVDRSAANVLRAVVEFIPGGAVIVQALQNSGVFDKVGAWVSDQISTLKMTGAALRDAANAFLGTLSWSDILDLGAVWERAKKIFSDPIDRIIAFVKDLAAGILKFIKDAILLPLAKLAEGTKGWDLLIAVLGKNPITGDAVPQTAETLIAGFLKLIGQDEIWQNMQKSNAIGRAWAWFKGAMAAVLAFVSQIPDLFVAAFKSLTVEDVVLVAGAFQKVASVFGGFLAKFTDWAGTAIWNLLEIIFDVVSPGALGYIKKTGDALKSILKNPLPFVGNLVKAAKLGFENFGANFGLHLKAGLIDWLTGSLPGVYLPKAVSLVEIGKFALSVLGITWAQIRAKIVKALGPNGDKIMTALETTFDVVVALVRGGPAAAWDLIKEKLSDLKDTVIDGLVSFVTDTIVKKAVPKLISLFVPGAGFISAILSIYDTVMVFVQKLAKIVAAVKAFVDSIVAIAAGQIEGAAAKVESTLAGLLSLAISFLAGFLGLGNIADKVMAVIQKVRATVDKAIDTAITWVVTKAKALFAKLFGAKDGKPDERTDKQKENDLAKAVAEADALLAVDSLTPSDVAKKLPPIRNKYRLTRLAIVTETKGDNSETDHVEGSINPVEKGPGRKKLIKDQKTNIYVKRSSFTATTKWSLFEDYPEQHRALVKGRPRLRKQLDRRHVISSQAMAAHYQTVLNRELWSKAKAILVGARGQSETVGDPLGDDSIQKAAQSRHSRFFNDIKNLFIDDASENRSIGAEKDIPEDWSQMEWRKHLSYIKRTYALSDEFTP